MVRNKKQETKGSTWANAIRRVNIFFKRITRQEVLTFLVFLVISTVFWALESASEESYVTYYIELEIKNIPSDIVFTTKVPKQIKLSFKDNNINLLSYSYGIDLDTLSVDFNSYSDALGNFRISGAALPKLLLNELYPSTQITSIVPSLIEAKFSETDGKKVPVVFVSEYSTAGNFRSHNPMISPDSVVVHAPNTILDTLTCVKTEKFIADNLQDTVKQSIPLNLSVGVKSSPEKINITIPVVQYVEKILRDVKINVIDVPEDKTLSIFPNKADISCLVDMPYYTNVTEKDFYLSVSYNSITSDTLKYIPIHLISHTDSCSVSNIKVRTNNVEYLIDSK